MKMNWGTKIILGMIAFMLFIVAMVVYMFSVHENDSLVAEDYYEKGINYDKEYNAATNVIKDKAEPKITINANQLIIQLKDSASYTLKLMRPSKAKDDINDAGKTVSDAHLILINTAQLHKGLWLFELNWESNGKAYFFKSNLTL